MSGTQAINAPRGSIFYPFPEDIVIIGLDTMDGPEHFLYDWQAIQDAKRLAESDVLQIAALGVKLATTIWKEKGTGRLLAVDGRHRVMLAREANKILVKRGEERMRIPVTVERGKTEDDAFNTMIGTDLRKRFNPVAQAKKISAAIARGQSEEEVAIKFGLSPSTIRNRLAFLQLHTECIDAVARGAATMTQVLEWKDLPEIEQFDKAKAVIAAWEASGGAPVDQEPAEAAGTVSATATTPKAPKTVKKRTGVRRPGKKLLREIVQDKPISEEVQLVISWVLGEISGADIARKVKGLSFLAEKKKRKSRKKETAGK